MRSNRGRWFLIGIVLAPAVLLALVGCVSGKTYRTRFDTAAFCTANDSEDCPGDILRVVATDPVVRTPALMGYVEFDDQGYPREPQSKKLLIDEFDALANDHPLLIVVFAHGWKHNAAGGDTNVESFQALLRKLATADAAACTNAPHCRDRQVVGIYMGWRGLSNSLEPFKSLTFWARACRRIGASSHTGAGAKCQAVALACHRGDDQRLRGCHSPSISVPADAGASMTMFTVSRTTLLAASTSEP